MCSNPIPTRIAAQPVRTIPSNTSMWVELARRPVGLWLGLLGQDVVEGLPWFLVLRQEFLEVGTGEVAGCRDQVLQRFPGVALQPDAQRRQYTGVRFRQPLGDLDLG